MDIAWLIPQNLTELSSLSQVLQLIVVTFGFIYGKRQLDELVKARNLEVTRELIDEIGNEEIRGIRTWLMHEFNKTPSLSAITAIDKGDLDKIYKLAVAYDRIGFLVSLGIVPENNLYKFQKDEIRLLWETCQPFIFYKRTQGKRPGYCSHFEYLSGDWLIKMERKYNPRWRWFGRCL
ncbi:hypothetical protein RPD76_03380 [Methylomonas sp. MV1]|uniref:DUF4760 domain-containing protein n=1 Tax=Methylomonas sp. MV1 TaxID=3073620 RepID=UPI0028A39283|nr:hypothetical protein [Methylomonas sp. MV1]MDT4328930.1 hypothetical protein [Methylomonas sp. MV1]